MKTKKQINILSFLIILQIVCACFIAVLSLFPTDLFSYKNTFEPLFNNIPIVLFVGIIIVKVINSIFVDPKNKKRKFQKIALSVLDLLGLIVFTYMVIGWAKEFLRINVAMSALVFIVYYILPFALIILCWLIQNVVIIFSATKKDVTDDYFILNKKQVVIISVLTSIGILLIILGKFIPVSVEEKLFGDNYKLAIAEKYNDFELKRIISNENDMISVSESGKIIPYYDITSGTLPTDKEVADTMIFEEDNIHLDYTLYNNADGKTYKFSFIGERKWFGAYEFRLDCDIREVLKDCPKM